MITALAIVTLIGITIGLALFGMSGRAEKQEKLISRKH